MGHLRYSCRSVPQIPHHATSKELRIRHILDPDILPAMESCRLNIRELGGVLWSLDVAPTGLVASRIPSVGRRLGSETTLMSLAGFGVVSVAVLAQLIAAHDDFLRHHRSQLNRQPSPCGDLTRENPGPLQPHDFLLLNLELVLRKNAAIHEVLQLLDHVDLFVQR